jgi:hypothetical protein
MRYFYFDITASDQTFRLCVAVCNCWVAPAGNTCSKTFSCLFLKKNNKRKFLYEISRVLSNCSPYLWNFILSGHECHFVCKKSSFFSVMRVEWGEELMFHPFLNSALYGGKWLGSGRGRFPPTEYDQGTQLCVILRGPAT